MPRFIPRRRYVTYRGEFGDLRRGLLRPDPDAVAAFEAALSRYHGERPVRTAASGRAALLAALAALGLRPGDEILVPAYTFRGVVDCLIDAGFVPVPVDIDAHTFNLDPAAARQRVGPRTRALLATHLFGRPCDLAALSALAADARLLLIEDAAQALGSHIDGCPVGSFGDAAILSFDLLKPVNTFGGGAVIFGSHEAASRLELPATPPPTGVVLRRVLAGLAEHAVLTTPLARLAAHALTHPRTASWLAGRYRRYQADIRPVATALAPVQAQIGRRLLASLDGRIALRRAQARQLARHLGETPAAAISPGENGYFFVRTVRGGGTETAALRRDLLAAGIDAGTGAEVADDCSDLGRATACPVARDVARRAIQLPLHAGLDDADFARIAAVCAGRLDLRK